jgi:hypothetical protein
VRNTQLDSSMPRPRAPRGEETLAPGVEDAPIRYWPPILATFGAALLLASIFALLAYVAGDITLGIVSEAGTGGGALLGPFACGLGFLICALAALYFLNSARVAAQDFGARPAHLDGVLADRHKGRGRSGGFWIVVRPHGAGATAAAPPPSVLAPAPRPSALAGADPLPGPDRRGFVQGSGASFVGSLADVTPTSTAETAPFALPPARARMRPGDLGLRVDKHVYNALILGEPVQVVYSPHLQHVFYVRKRSPAGDTVILRNLSLI